MRSLQYKLFFFFSLIEEHCKKIIRENGGVLVEAQMPNYYVGTFVRGRSNIIFFKRTSSVYKSEISDGLFL